MDWETQLISVYLNVCEYFLQDREKSLLRLSPNSNPKFTDEEAISVFIFGKMKVRSDVKSIHKFAFNHLKEWFPNLTKYEAFNNRLNFLNDKIHQFSEFFMQRIDTSLDNDEKIIVVDSMPIVMSKGYRAQNSKTARNVCNNGYCSSKNMHYYGVKFHLFADRNETSLAIPRLGLITKANVHDLKAVRDEMFRFSGHKIIGDKAYADRRLKQELMKSDVEIYTPIKLSRSKKTLSDNEKLFTKIVSSVRQSIEIFFNWIIEKTSIQNASKVRSERGLIKHLFGCLAAAFLERKLNP